MQYLRIQITYTVYAYKLRDITRTEELGDVPRPKPIAWIERAVVNIRRKINIFMLFCSQTVQTTLAAAIIN